MSDILNKKLDEFGERLKAAANSSIDKAFAIGIEEGKRIGFAAGIEAAAKEIGGAE